MEPARKLGEGSFSEVWSDPARPGMAVKRCKRRAGWADGDVQRDAEDEYIAMMLCRPAGLAKWFLPTRFERVSGHPKFVADIVMPRAHSDLLRLLRRHPQGLPPGDFRNLARALTAHLRDISSSGYVHRDIKPANVLLAVCGDLRSAFISDFGLASSDPADGGIGTYEYMPPEALAEMRARDRSVDVWSLGVVLWECAFGTHPFPGTREQSMTAIRARTAPQPPCGHDNARFARALLAMLNPDPTARCSATRARNMFVPLATPP
jgi:serine/threonine protein kinase